MSVEAFVAEIVDFVKQNEALAVPIAFIVAFAESFCFFSIVWPGTAILAGITALLAASGADQSIVIPSIISAGLGGTLGYAISFWIGLYFKNSIERIWPFQSRPELLEHGKRFFSRWGGWGIFFGHFIGPVRAVIPVVSGMFQMNQITFQIANMLSAFLWSAVIIAPSFFLVTLREDITIFIQGFPETIGACLLVLAYVNSLPYLVLSTLILFFILGETYLFYGGSFLISFCAAGIGAFLGDCTSYYLGRRQYNAWKYCSINNESCEAKHKAISYLTHQGAVGIFLSKFYPSLRAFVPLAAGIRKDPIGKFLFLSLLSSFTWAGVLLSPIPLLRYF